ncbi:hypothetical protein SAMN06265373_10822 [Shimia sagamensis]|uniref:Uncharacterized protein n=1 Tax=Shimia sagamensis TaxID=1566352 RepID=A0ABY1PD47_9RHOB|nr:hypothetical protein SAMN06265373_10822 [Shimia sagamensis]
MPLTQIGRRRTPSFRAKAKTERLRPMVRVNRIPQVMIFDPAIVRMSKAFAA